MNIMELGALGEFVGSIGVIATFVYLGFTRGMKARSRWRAGLDRKPHCEGSFFRRWYVIGGDQLRLASRRSSRRSLKGSSLRRDQTDRFTSMMNRRLNLVLLSSLLYVGSWPFRAR